MKKIHATRKGTLAAMKLISTMGHTLGANGTRSTGGNGRTTGLKKSTTTTVSNGLPTAKGTAKSNNKYLPHLCSTPTFASLSGSVHTVDMPTTRSGVR